MISNDWCKNLDTILANMFWFLFKVECDYFVCVGLFLKNGRFFRGRWVHGKDLGVWIGCLPQDTTITLG
jgi:hypothetical protein